jgi:hypothetical protein
MMRAGAPSLHERKDPERIPIIRLSITPAAFEAIAAALALSSVGFESEADANGERSSGPKRSAALRL